MSNVNAVQAALMAKLAEVEEKIKGKTLGEVKDRVLVAEVVNEGTQLILPENCSIDEGIDLLQRRKKYMTEQVVISATFDAFPWDGANALNEVLTARYGWSESKATQGMFGKNPPQLREVEVGLGKTVKVPWGALSIPGVEGELRTGAVYKNGLICFQLHAIVLRAHEAEINALFDKVREYLKTSSIYAGKALRIRFCDDEGNGLEFPEINFIDTEVDPAMLVYSKDVEESIRTNLFTPITRHKELAQHGIPFKRGVLLGGVFGTGKTLAAKVASKLAIENGLTYIYVPRADELKPALEFAKLYQSPASVVFCEDVDRVTAGNRSVKMDDVLNIIDGVDTKNTKVMVVLTTNALDTINPAMLRPGRLDAVIEVTPPDAEAVQRLLRVYGKDSIDPSEDLSEAGEVLNGCIPAVIAEVVRRATLHQLSLNAPGERVTRLSGRALANAARSMAGQLALLNRDTKAPSPTLHSVMTEVIGDVVNEKLTQISNRVEDVANAL